MPKKPQSKKRVKIGEPGYRHPYMEYEGTQMWNWVHKAITNLVNNQDLVETEDRSYTVGYICKTIANGQKRTSRVSS